MSHSDQLQDLFAEAIEIPSAERRAAFLDSVCRDDSDLRRQLDALLRAHRDAGEFFREDSTGNREDGANGTSPGEEVIGTMIGPYRIVSKLGQGGFGVVYVAEQSEPIRRNVALKVIKPGMDTREVIARFDAERQALALMEHPSIAKVLGAGATDQGRPYFVMELFNGLPICEYCDAHQLTLSDRLELFGDVCRAIEHAHQKGIIHRDLKPSNILVAPDNDGFSIKIIDFGVAKALDEPLTDKTLRTLGGQALGTPHYMSPEQATAPDTVDTRTDIYALGVILYELLTGTTPIPRGYLREVGPEEFRRTLENDDPPKPSARIRAREAEESDDSDSPRLDSRRLASRVRGDLDWLVMKAIDKEPDRRYPTASALADDVARYLSHQPIEAGPPTKLYRIAKVARRNRVAIAIGAVIVISLISGFSVATTQAIRAGKAETLAQNRLKSIQREQARTAAALSRTEAAERDQRRLRKLSEARELRSRQLVYASDLRLAGLAWDRGDIRTLVDLLDRQVPDSAANDLRGFEWWHLKERIVAPSIPISDGRSGVGVARFTPDGRYLMTGHDNGKIHLWDGETFAHQMTLPGHDSSTNGIDLSQDGSLLASVGDDHLLRLWNLHTGREITQAKADDGHVHRVFFVGDGSRLVSSGEAPEIKLWDQPSLKITDRHDGFETAIHHGIKQRLAISPDRQRCVAADQYQTARVYELDSGDIVCTLDVSSGRFVRCLRYSPDGRLIAGGRYNQEITIWDAETGEVLQRFVGHLDDVQDVAFHPDGNLLASCDKSGVVRTWRLKTDQRQIPPTGVHLIDGDLDDWPRFFVAHDSRVYSLDFSNDGNTLVTACNDSSVRGWRAKRIRRCITGKSTLEPQAVWLDSHTLVVAAENELVFWDLDTGEKRSGESGDEQIQSVAIATDRQRIATGHVEGTIRIWDVATRKVVKTLRAHQQQVHSLAFSPYDGSLVSAGQDGQLIRWDVDTGEPTVLKTFRFHCKSVAVSPTSPLIAVTVQDDVLLYSLDGAAEPIRLRGHQNSADCVVFSPDGRYLASGSDDRTIRIWDAASGRPKHVIHAHQSKIESIAFSPDGRTIASGDKNAMISFSHVESGRILCSIDLAEYWDDLEIDRENPWVSDLQFSSDGRQLSTSLLGVGHAVLTGNPAAGGSR